MQTRTANRLALAASQREQRHIWQDMMFYMGEHSAEYREFIHNYEDMAPDRKAKAVMAFFAMGNQLDMLIKLNAEGLETKDNLRYVMDAFVGHMSTPGGYKFWKSMSDIDLSLYFESDIVETDDDPPYEPKFPNCINIEENY